MRVLASSTALIGLALGCSVPACTAPGDPPGADVALVPPRWIKGYARDGAGAVMDYDSALPEIGSALLVRSRAAEHSVAWETEVVPAEIEGERVAFVWLFGMDVDAERHRFELRVPGLAPLEFFTPSASALEAWSVSGERGASLRFLPTRLDRHGDVFGFAALELPRDFVVPGQPLRLEVRGDDSGSPIWYMTFRGAPRAGARIVARPAVLRDERAPWQPLVLEIVHVGAPAEASIASSFGAPRNVRLELGINRVELSHPRVEKPVDERVSVHVDDGSDYELSLRVEPVRPWTIHLVQHTHTDIGYTRPQTEILPDHLRYIDYALDYCDLTDAHPDEARFRWTCEGSWAVREFLRARPPDQIERLRRRVAEGRIELTAMFANLSEVLDEPSCAASLEPLRAMREARLPVVTAMQDDVNGIAWCYVEMLAALGVRYLDMGQHGHRALVPFDVPTAFSWESPSGARLLAWRADHYMTGNFWGLQTGRFEAVEPPLFRRLVELEQSGYPFEHVSVQYSGVFLDNAPPSTSVCDFIRRWNERYEWPRLESSTASTFLRWVEREHANDLLVHAVAWPDWWSDGIGTAPRELAAARATQTELTATEGVLALVRRLGTKVETHVLERIAEARERLVMYGEHTYGAAESISDPLCENTQVQWAQKAAYVWDAVKESALAKETALGLLQSHLPRADKPTVAVVNTLSSPRTGSARVWIDRELAPPGRRVRFVDERGEAPAQLVTPSPEGSVWALMATDVPPLGFRSYRIEVGGEATEDAAPAHRAAEGAGPSIENRFYRLRLDPKTGALASLFDRELKRELCDAEAPHQLGQLVCEVLGNRSQLERRMLDDFSREVALPTRVEIGPSGPVFQSLVVHGSSRLSPGADGFRLEIRLFEQVKRVEFHYRVRKRRNFEPESLYAAFPFALPGARVRYETCGGVVDPTRDLLPGTSSDWLAVQGFVSIESDDARILWSSRDAPLVQLGGLNVGRFERTARVERPYVYSWLLNNYWVTNFLASSEGELCWSHALTSGKPGSDGDAMRFGLESSVPMPARVLPPAKEGESPGAVSLLDIEPREVVLLGARPARAGAGVVLHVRQTADRSAAVRVTAGLGSNRALRVRRVDALEEPLGTASESVTLAPHEACFLLLDPER